MGVKKHLLFLISNDKLFGYEGRYLNLFYFLHKRNYRVSLIMNRKLLMHKSVSPVKNILTDPYIKKNVFFVSLPKYLFIKLLLNKLTTLLFNKSLFIYLSTNIINNINPDIIYNNNSPKSTYTLKKTYGFNVVHEFTSPDMVDSFFLNGDYKFSQYMHKIAFVSRSVEKRFNHYAWSNNVNFNCEKITASIPFYTFIDDYDFEFNNKENIMVYAHRFIKRKNPMLYAKLVKRMCKDTSFQNWRFCLFGRGPLKVPLSNYLSDEIKTGKVEFGYRNNLVDYLKRSKIFFSLIEPDNYPSQSVMQAMYCGNTLILTNTGYSNEFIFNNGILVDKNEEIIYQRLKFLVKSDLETASKNSISYAKKKFAPEKYLKYIDSILN